MRRVATSYERLAFRPRWVLLPDVANPHESSAVEDSAFECRREITRG
jgi:hypothetical protein